MHENELKKQISQINKAIKKTTYVNHTDVYNKSVDIPKFVLFFKFSVKTQTRKKCCRFYWERVTVIFFLSLALNRDGRFSFLVRNRYGRIFFPPELD